MNLITISELDGYESSHL